MKTYTIKQVANMLGLSRATVFRYIKQGKIKAEKKQKKEREVYIITEVPWQLAKTDKRENSSITNTNTEALKAFERDIFIIKENQNKILETLRKIEDRLSLEENQPKNTDVAIDLPTDNNQISQENILEIEELRQKVKEKIKLYGSVKQFSQSIKMSDSTIGRFLKGSNIAPATIEKIKQAIR